MTQEKQVSRIEYIDIKIPAHQLKVNYVTQRACGAYVVIVSQPEAILSQSQASQVCQPAVEDTKLLNKCLVWQIENIKMGIQFVSLDIN